MLVNDNDESRRMVEICYRRHKTTIKPIIDWSDADVWEFIRRYNVQYCSLYDDGLHRLGCIGCPMAGTRSREREFLRWPKYKAAYLRAFTKMLEGRKLRRKLTGTWDDGTTPMDVYNWWMEYDTLPGQMDLLEDYDE